MATKNNYFISDDCDVDNDYDEDDYEEDDYEDYYEEPSETDKLIEQLTTTLKSQVKDDIKNHIKELEDENKRMKDIVSNYDNKLEELTYKERELEREKNNMRSQLEYEVRNERLTKLLEDFSTKYWEIYNGGKEQPKCDKCDKYGYIHFLSPSGKDCKEKCSCQKRLPFFTIKQMDCEEFKIIHSNGNEKIVGWFKPHKEPDKDDYYSSSYYVDKKVIYSGQPYNTIEKYYDVFFRTPEEAQKYADWLNKQNENK